MQSLPGTFDILPEETQERWKSAYLWQYIEENMRERASLFGFEEIRTPILERTELFQRSVGEETDIVSKEMYTFLDRGERSVTLRPEGTAPAVRLFIEHGLIGIHKWFYICPMFRYERMQKGRYRQHHQFGVEAIGTHSIYQDVEIMLLLYGLYQKLGIKNISLQINSLGDRAARKVFHEALVRDLMQKKQKLSEESQVRLLKNPLRILDSKDPEDQKVLEGVPRLEEYLSRDSKERFSTIQELLMTQEVPFTVNGRLVRGLDYYNDTVFEVVTDDLGAQNSLGGGGAL